jgi:hypothetical protein
MTCGQEHEAPLFRVVATHGAHSRMADASNLGFSLSNASPWQWPVRMSPVCHAMCACTYCGLGWKRAVATQPKWPSTCGTHLRLCYALQWHSPSCALHTCKGSQTKSCIGLLSSIVLGKFLLSHVHSPSCPALLSMVARSPAPELATSAESKRGPASVCGVARLTRTALAMQKKGASTSAPEQMVGLLKPGKCSSNSSLSR